MANERLTRGGGSASSVAEDTETAPNAESVKEPVDGHAVDANDPLSDDPLADDPLSDDQNADPASGRAVDADPTARSETDFASDATGEATGEEIAPTDATESQDTTAPADHVDHADPVDADASTARRSRAPALRVRTSRRR